MNVIGKSQNFSLQSINMIRTKEKREGGYQLDRLTPGKYAK